MYARLIYFGALPAGDADFGRRLCETARGLGHAVMVCERPDEGGGCKAALAAIEAFRPSLLVWDVASLDPSALSPVLEAARCLRAALLLEPEDVARVSPGLFDVVLCAFGNAGAPSGPVSGLPEGLPSLSLGPFPDERYVDAATSDPSLAREGVGVWQPPSDEARSELAMLDGVRIVRMSPEWPGSLDESVPGCCLAYWARTVRYSCFFAGEGLSDASVALRVAEGALVLAPMSALASIRDRRLREAVVAFPPRGLAGAIASLDADEAARLDALAAQRSALEGRTLEGSLPAALARLDALAREAGRGPVLACGERATEVVLFGWFGAQNFGDDLLMTVVRDRIERRYENPLVSVIGADAGELRREFGCPAMTPDQKAEIRRALLGASAVVYCGGLVFDDPLAQTAGELELFFDPWIEPTGQAAVSLLARLHGVPSVYLGIGAGPLANDETRSAVRAMGLAGATMLPRDENSVELFLASGVDPTQVTLAADLVLGAREYVNRVASHRSGGAAGGPYFVVSLREWHLNPEGLCASVAALVDGLVRATGARAVFVPFDADDVAVHERVVALMGEGASAESIGERPSAPELLGLMAGSRFAVAMRLHCSILHHVLGKPAVGLDYNDKVHAHFVELDQADLLLPLGFGRPEADAAVARLEAALRSPRASTARALEKKSERVEMAYGRLWDAISGMSHGGLGRQVYYPRTVSRFESDLIAERSRARELERELEAERSRRAEAERRESDVRSSHSYRLGNALLRLPAALKGRLGRGL